MVDLVHCLRTYYFFKKLPFNISLLYYHINLRSSIVFCLSSGGIYLSLGIFLSCSFLTVSQLFCCEFLETIFQRREGGGGVVFAAGRKMKIFSTVFSRSWEKYGRETVFSTLGGAGNC